jgi:hypothetical protein
MTEPDEVMEFVEAEAEQQRDAELDQWEDLETWHELLHGEYAEA